MVYLPPQRWPWIVLAYAGLGFLTGGVTVDFGPIAASAGLSAKVGVAIEINLVLPAIAIILAAVHPKLWVIWIGAATLTLFALLGELVRRDWHIWEWPMHDAVRLANPFRVVPTVGYGVLGTVAAVVASPWRTVGEPHPEARCGRCGYAKQGNTSGTCSECGAALDIVPPAA